MSVFSAFASWCLEGSDERSWGYLKWLHNRERFGANPRFRSAHLGLLFHLPGFIIFVRAFRICKGRGFVCCCLFLQATTATTTTTTAAATTTTTTTRLEHRRIIWMSLHAVFEHVVQLFQLFVVLGVKVLAIFTGAMQHPKGRNAAQVVVKGGFRWVSEDVETQNGWLEDYLLSFC